MWLQQPSHLFVVGTSTLTDLALRRMLRGAQVDTLALVVRK